MCIRDRYMGMEIENTLAHDNRLSLKEIYAIWDETIPSTWFTRLIATQKLKLPNGQEVTLPIFAYYNSLEIDTILIGGIHGREPAGAVAITKEASFIVEQGENRSILVLPLMNPWGYYNHIRYGPSGNSVTDCMYALGRDKAPLCEESEKIVHFFLNEIKILKGATVLDLHEDPGYEEGGTPYKETGTYLYLIGEDAKSHQITHQIKSQLQKCPLPLINNGMTRFHETIKDGIIENSPDGSIDEFLSVLGASPVLTLETLLLSETCPPINARVNVYQQVIRSFLQ
eukprot:TRINITY_DN1190_c0_g1_i2.p1 TRINITY_DN1190_c0_g1~~TRINITY_DN1190_c0_g1_i2.p1  ORF type:complete len:285 (-),score=68.11 TRINITY_DN1190_c0_g1_i2:43-897(-)